MGRNTQAWDFWRARTLLIEDRFEAKTPKCRGTLPTLNSGQKQAPEKVKIFFRSSP